MTDVERIESEVAQLFARLQFPSSPEGLYDPLRYMMSLGGKRIRPSLCLAAYSLWNGVDFSPAALRCAEGLEIFHSFTLLHDDIMDRSPLRRGSPTVWKKWDENTAILSGDVMLVEAYKRIALAPGTLDLFSATAAQVCEGQQYDMDFESLESVPMEAYNKMIGLKTAVLLACSAACGGIVAGASKTDCDALYSYAYSLGMAFQVADDYLDAYGDEKVFGKPIGGDIINAKKSWLTVRALEKTPDTEAFLAVFGRQCRSELECREKIAAVKALYDSLGVPAEALAQIRLYSNEALSALGAISVPTSVLSDFATRLIGRVK